MSIVGVLCEFDDLRQRCAGEENAVHPLLLHARGIGFGNGPAAAAKHANVVRAALSFQQINHFSEKLDVTTVVTRKADRAHVLLGRCAYNVTRRTMVSEIDDLEAASDELQVDGVDGAIVPVADRNRGQQSDGWLEELSPARHSGGSSGALG